MLLIIEFLFFPLFLIKSLTFCDLGFAVVNLVCLDFMYVGH